MKLETTAAPPERRRCAITRYSWLDEDTKIRIYIPVDDERFQRPDAITLTWTEKSVALAADLGDEVHTFAVPALYDTIVGASHRVKPTKIVVTLKKPPDRRCKWRDLKSGASESSTGRRTDVPNELQSLSTSRGAPSRHADCMTFSSFMRSLWLASVWISWIPVSRDVLLRARIVGWKRKKRETMRKLAAFGCLWAVAAKLPPAHGQRRQSPHSVHQSRRRGPAARVGNAENHGTVKPLRPPVSLVDALFVLQSRALTPTGDRCCALSGQCREADSPC